jgi:molybdate transport system substrate-binding protein
LREDATRFFKMTAAAAAIAAMATSAQAADIKVICSNGFQAVMHELGPQYERATGHKLVVSYGLAAVLGKEIEGGEAFDLTILAPPQIDALIRQGKIAADSRAVLARSGIGVMVRSGARLSQIPDDTGKRPCDRGKGHGAGRVTAVNGCRARTQEKFSYLILRSAAS